ncbi:AAA family ATPase [Enterobacter cancerogenus]|uniref:ATP-dependent nuclease n=1 Tax=Enterobacter cancerogenus TaxID=69218 RepID=UPI000C78BD26|nr:AAA family ATPase [Enterobacter cancerogenus]AUJ83190.1 AAA family ATPase [Enterobacter cancerogenus]
MIKEIKIHRYRKLENLDFTFDPTVNIISGTNGTCKTSLLHIISNSVKSPGLRSEDFENPNCFKIIRNTNVLINPKIEALVRDAKQYNDPANGLKGNLFEVEYTDGKQLKFRKHNSKIQSRYAIKPYYGQAAESQYLPSCPVIYLGLSRLFPTGEIVDDTLLSNGKLNLPESYLNRLTTLYSQLINIDMENVEIKKISTFKSGPEFTSTVDGIDSNTISSGEDNLFIILKSLISLSYYYENLINKDNCKSILLIDEYDATLHPSLQEKLFDIITEYSEKYNIQVFMTTHSLSLLEYAIENKNNVIYLLNNYTDVELIENPSIIDIKMHLRNDTRDNIYNKKRIPVFMEDDEARFVLNEIFDYFSEHDKSFNLVRRFFHLVPSKIGADNLATIFKDPYLLETSLKSICILDGDKSNSLERCTMKLPGKESPEVMFFKYIEQIYTKNDTSFWRNKNITKQGYTKQKFLSDIRPDILAINAKIEEFKAKNGTTKGIERELNKTIFNKHINLFRLVILHWLQNDENNDEILSFARNLEKLFYKVCIPNGIERKEWQFRYHIERI